MSRRPLVFLGLLVGFALAALMVIQFGGDDPPAAGAASRSSSNTAEPVVTQPAATEPGEPTAKKGKGEDLPGTEDAVVSGRDAAEAVCAVRPAELDGLTRVTPKSPALENLRDGLPLLGDRIVEVEQAAEGRPALAPVAARLNRIQASWARALRAHDAHHEKAARAALARGDRQIDRLQADIAALFDGETPACKA